LGGAAPQSPAPENGPRTTEIYALGTRLSGTLISFGGTALILFLLTPERMGVFLTVASLAALSALADLGLGYSFLLATSSKTGTEVPTLAATAVNASIPIVTVSGVSLFAGGSVFLFAVHLPAIVWLLPWAAHCALMSVSTVLMLAVTLAEGSGRRHEAWRANFVLEIVAGVAYLSAIALHCELWAFAAASFVRIAMIAVPFRRIFPLPASGPVSIRRSFQLWGKEIWPMQWRNLLNAVAGLLTTRSLIPLLLATEGAVLAGRVGLALNLCFTILGITSAWPLSQTAVYAAWYEQRQVDSLLALLRATFLKSLLLSFGLCLAAGLAVEVLRAVDVAMTERLPGTVVLVLILAAAVAGHATYCFAIYLRARRSDPVVFANLVFTIPTLIILWVSATVSPEIFAGAFLGCSLFFAALYGGYLRVFVAEFRRSR
jgi:uncharacterized MnhB-related membrane protein